MLKILSSCHFDFSFIYHLFNRVSPIEIKDLLYKGDLAKRGAAQSH